VERVQPVSPVVEESESKPVSPERDPARLPVLIAAVQGTSVESERRLLATEINRLLEDMRAPGNEAAEAKAVLAALDVEALADLVDENGKSCRAEAVETLLACGFPHALQVKPEDLQFRDEDASRRKKTTRNLAIAGGGVAVLLVTLLALLGESQRAFEALFAAPLLLWFLYDVATATFESKPADVQTQKDAAKQADKFVVPVLAGAMGLMACLASWAASRSNGRWPYIEAVLFGFFSIFMIGAWLRDPKKSDDDKRSK
jgi:hypothetical protein